MSVRSIPVQMSFELHSWAVWNGHLEWEELVKLLFAWCHKAVLVGIAGPVLHILSRVIRTLGPASFPYQWSVADPMQRCEVVQKSGCTCQGCGEKDSVSDFLDLAFSMLGDQFPFYISFTKENTVFQVPFSLLQAFPGVQDVALQAMAKLSFRLINFLLGELLKINEHITYEF